MNFDRKAVFAVAKGWLAAILVIAGCVVASAPVRAASFQPLEIVTRSGVQVFSVEVATTEEEKQTGLMYRKELADGKGMLFDFNPEQEVSMWMKNTYVSLDMIFIRADGRILRIAENTEPMSTKIISSRGPRGLFWRWWQARRRNMASAPATAWATRCSAASRREGLLPRPGGLLGSLLAPLEGLLALWEACIDGARRTFGV